MNDTLPNAQSSRWPNERDKLLRVIEKRGLCGLANDTKWNELIGAMRRRTDWRPSYRYKCIDGPPSTWDVEWFYHLPFPMLSVEWLDISPVSAVVDHSAWIEELIKEVGLDYHKGATTFRIFGYSPRNMELFED